MENDKHPFRWAIAAVLFLSILCLELSYSILPPLFSEISEDIPLSKAQMGLIFGMVPMSGIIFPLIGGVITDRFGSRLAVTGALIIAAVFGGLRSIASSAFELAVLTFAVGAALALIPPNVAKVIGAWFPQHELGKANGLVMSAAPIGVGLGLGIGASVLSPNLGGWRGVMNFVAVLSLMAGVVWALVYREREPKAVPATGQQNILKNFKKIFIIRDVWLIALFFGFFYYTVGSLISLLPIILEERGISQAGQLAALLLLAAVFGGPLGGVASDKVGQRKPFLIVPVIVMGICIPFFIILTGIPLVVALVITGFAQGMVIPIMMTTLIQSKKISAIHIATAVGMVIAFGNGIGFFGPVVSGNLMDMTGSPWSAFILMAAILIIAAGAVIPLERGVNDHGSEVPRNF